MNVFKVYYMVLILMSFLFISNLNAQSIDSTEVSNDISDGDIVEAGESIIKIEVEKPQVQLFSQRIKPEFDEVNLEKSFRKEILDEGQSLKFIYKKNEEAERINVKKLLTRKR